ncbi:MAG TPA: immunity 53 family protein [Capsulimonadaceae bacterium]|jgi:hypothetical protein
MNISDTLSDIQKWYAAQCDGDWEHSYSISITTMDNPGWSVTINLTRTILEEKKFESVEQGLDDGTPDASWISCDVRVLKDDFVAFVGRGGPGRLDEILQVFLTWAKSEPDWLAVPPEATEEDLDREYWAKLPNDDSSLGCSQDGCSRNRISFSVFCRKHHFEAVRKKPCMFEPA